ncbi:MAG: hypothetical protein OXI96_08240 [Acidimicrobiaceae bacterium]|nr:hypothetical protein [Acidimicrobiaceae bacterium]
MSSSEELIRPVEVQAREPYRIWLCYSDGVEGEVDLSHLAGRGVFGAWVDRSFFAEPLIGPSRPWHIDESRLADIAARQD